MRLAISTAWSSESPRMSGMTAFGPTMTVLALIAMAAFLHPAIAAQAGRSEYCAGPRFLDTVFSFSTIRLDTGVVYGTAAERLGAVESLRMDIVFPDTAVDPLFARPCIVFVHGGGFHSGSRTVWLPSCVYYAMRGYVAATLSYRLGWDTGSGVESCDGNPEGMIAAMYRGMQDVRTGIRFLSVKARQYGIDTAWCFLAGGSAGGFLCLSTAFVRQDEIDSRYAWLRPLLGPLDFGAAPLTIRGVVNMWGGVLDTGMISAHDTVPCLLFHTTADTVAPYESGPVFGCVTPRQFPIVYGSKAIALRLSHLGICGKLLYSEEATHGMSDINHIDPHIACFLKSLLCGACVSSESAYGPAPACDVSTHRQQTYRPRIGLASDKQRMRITPVLHGGMRVEGTNASAYDLYGRRVAKRDNHGIMLSVTEGNAP